MDNNREDIAIGKIADTFSYPYTIKLTGANRYGEKKNYSGTAIFNNETNFYFYFEYIPKGENKVKKMTTTFHYSYKRVFNGIDTKENSAFPMWYLNQLSSK